MISKRPSYQRFSSKTSTLGGGGNFWGQGPLWAKIPILTLRLMSTILHHLHIGIIGIEPNRTEPNRTEPIWFVFGLRDHVFRIPHQILCPVHQTGAQTDSSRVFWGQIIEKHDFQKKMRAAISCRMHRSLRRKLSRGAYSRENVIFKKVASWYPGIPVTGPW